MLSKETFLKALALIREQEKINDNFSKALEAVGDGHFLYGVNNKYHEALMLVLKESVHDKYDYIEWWLYETTDYKVWTEDGRNEWNLKKPEALYDYIVNECS